MLKISLVVFFIHHIFFVHLYFSAAVVNLTVLCLSSQPVVTSQLGTVNNVIQVKKTDFEVFDALMVDSQKCSDMSGEC